MKAFRTTFLLSCLLVTLSARADIRDELDALLAEDPITEGSVSRIRELGDATSRQNLQQLCYKTACAGFAALGDTTRYEETLFARHCLDLAAYAVFTNRESTTIERNKAFPKIAARAYVPRGFSSAILLYRYPNGKTFEVSDVSTSEDVFHVRLRKPGDVWTKTLVIPRSESEVAFWKKGRSVTSRDWVFAAPAYYPLAPSLQGFFSTATSTIYRSLAEFRRLHPGAEDTETP